jgi:hypothetical protein
MLKFIIAACQVAVETENNSRSTAYLNRRLGGDEYLTLCLPYIHKRESHMDLLNRMHKMSNVITITVVFLIVRLSALFDDREKHEIQLQFIIYRM